MKWKIFFIIGFLVGLCWQCHAQTFAEWFQQKKTQRKYLLEQIALYQTYLGYVKKGYTVARQGTDLIHSITNGEFSLHHAFFGSLEKVNPAVKNYSRVTDIIASQRQVVLMAREGMRQAHADGMFAADKVRLFDSVFEAILDQVTETVSVLKAIIVDRDYKMKDDERLRQIDRLYARSCLEMQAASGLYKQIGFVADNKRKQAADLLGTRAVYGIE